MSDINALIERWRVGDERATEALYNYHQGQVFRLAYGILGNWQDAQEITQDVLIYALTKIDRYNPQRARFSTWLHIITVSRCRNKLRNHRFWGLSLTAWSGWRGGDVPDLKLDQEAQVIQAELRDEVWIAIQNLSQPLREAIILRHWAELTRLIIGDILTIVDSGWRSAITTGNSILMSFDPVAHDAVGLHMFSEAWTAAGYNSAPATGTGNRWLENGVALGLGTNNPDDMALVEVDLE